MYIYRNSLVLHLHSISIMRCWMGRMQLYLFYFYVSSIIFQPHSILCFYILSIHIMCDLRRVERCHLENSLQMPKHFTFAEVRDFWENIFPLSRRFEATLYALWLASDNCDFCINTFSEFSESSGLWKISLARLAHNKILSNAFLMHSECVVALRGAKMYLIAKAAMHFPHRFSPHSVCLAPAPTKLN